MRATLLRFADTPHGVFGFLVLEDGADRLVLCTVEDDWLDNAPTLSCIMEGSYLGVRVMYAHGGYEVFEITGVPGRSHILLHIANSEEDVEGCVGVGLGFGFREIADEDVIGHPVHAKWDVTSSKVAFERLMAFFDKVQSFPITVRWARPGEWRSLIPPGTVL